MRILHYALGFAPYRTGGLTVYVMDVMAQQCKQGHQVGLLWPGRMRFLGEGKPAVKRSRKDGIDSYELINPLPVPLLEGVLDIPAYTRACDVKVFLEFLKAAAPEVIHVHTFMGLYQEFLQAAGELQIPVVYTTHDYYPLCPRVNLICGERDCGSGMADERCPGCNAGALSVSRIRLMQSACYRGMKDTALLRMLRNMYKRRGQQRQTEKLSDEQAAGQQERPAGEQPAACDNKTLSYRQLKNYYQKMLERVDLILCNSSIAMERYQSLGGVTRVCLLPITNAKIRDKRQKKKYPHDKPLSIGYLGAATQAKGFYFLREILDTLASEGKENFCLHVYTPVAEPGSYMQIHTPFTDEAGMEAAYRGMDVLAVPSLWRETFGFVVSEALSYGVPVIVTECVGAKNLIENGLNGYCVSADQDAFKSILERLISDRDILAQMNENIVSGSFLFSMEEHVKRLEDCYLNAKEEDHT